jgi:uncharacterized membrane protein HdeD (DUF308 family)
LIEKRRDKSIEGRRINMSVNTEIKRAVGWSIALSVLMIAAGVLAIIAPPVSGIAVTILVGWLLVFRGAII